MKQIIQNALNSADLTDKINDAAPEKIKIMSDYRKDMAEVMDSYIGKMIELNPKIKKILDKKKKDRTDEEKALYIEFVKKEKNKFKAIKKAICPIVRSDGTKESPLLRKISDLVTTCKMLAYLGRDEEIKRLFTENGLTLTFDPIEKTSPELAPDSVREVMKYIFTSAEEVDGQIQESKTKIKDAYLDLDPAIRFSSVDPKNLEGLKASQFEKLVKQRAVQMTKSSEEYTKFCQKIQETSEADITSLELTLEKSQEM